MLVPYLQLFVPIFVWILVRIFHYVVSIISFIAALWWLMASVTNGVLFFVLVALHYFLFFCLEPE